MYSRSEEKAEIMIINGQIVAYIIYDKKFSLAKQYVLSRFQN